jgi:hypothetical protein
VATAAVATVGPELCVGLSRFVVGVGLRLHVSTLRSMHTLSRRGAVAVVPVVRLAIAHIVTLPVALLADRQTTTAQAR